MDNENVINYWVEYIDDYNDKHLTTIQKEVDLKYIQNNYDIINIETVGA